MFEILEGRMARSIDDALYRKYAVMVPLLLVGGEIHVLFEKRAGGLRRQPGEICFPGGARDPGEGSREAAVRETMEELLVSREQIQVIAQMDTMYTAYQNKISAYLCELKDYGMSFEQAEVAEVFTVPLRFFLETAPKVYYNKVILQQPEDFPFDKVPGGRDYPWRAGRAAVYFYEYESHVIWGLTAYIMQGVVRILKTEAGVTAGSLPE